MLIGCTAARSQVLLSRFAEENCFLSLAVRSGLFTLRADVTSSSHHDLPVPIPLQDLFIPVDL